MTKIKIISVKSAGYEGGNSAQILVDNKPVELVKNHNNHQRGLHIVIINPKNDKVEWA